MDKEKAHRRNKALQQKQISSLWKNIVFQFSSQNKPSGDKVIDQFKCLEILPKENKYKCMAGLIEFKRWW